jgi:hypothetical protein
VLLIALGKEFEFAFELLVVTLLPVFVVAVARVFVVPARSQCTPLEVRNVGLIVIDTYILTKSILSFINKKWYA